MLDWLISIDLVEIFAPTMSPLEAVLRISVVYLFLFSLLRVVLKREAAAIGITDLLVVVLIADAVQNAMADEYRSVTDGLVLGATLVFWDWALSYAAARWRRFGRVIRPAPLLLVRNGEPIWDNLRKEHLTEEELASHVRLQGLERIEDVKYAFMETDGRISVIPKEGNQSQGSRDKNKAI
ncbi:MAG: DUF421 domain-containing protein [Chloroflexi bacterium]|nr:DUF421 domain-containing protein [Chloroflexota bacterium]